ncbi:uncharacterized protein VTP21DRAFT_6151 [Calcarisporiella thermophila]|uniref:uncharacterized protein n=1 Tax=Calcarisporiella thermophila TaxID=911321 RepID=UPI0037433B96
MPPKRVRCVCPRCNDKFVSTSTRWRHEQDMMRWASSNINNPSIRMEPDQDSGSSNSSNLCSTSSPLGIRANDQSNNRFFDEEEYSSYSSMAGEGVNEIGDEGEYEDEDEDEVEDENGGESDFESVDEEWELTVEDYDDLTEEMQKNLRNSIEMHYPKIKVIFNTDICQYQVKKILHYLVGFKPNTYDCCVNSCIAFTREYAHLEECPYCKERRFELDPFPMKIARKVFYHFPLINRLLFQYQNPARSEELRYRAQYVEHSNGDISSPEYKFGDIFDGKRYKELVQAGFFTDPRDIALSGSVDAFKLFKTDGYDCWPVILINHNLAPKERVKKQNILFSTLVPGPRLPKDFNSFLVPLVDELEQLEVGVPCFDGSNNQNFTLRAHTVFWSGDMSTISKLAEFSEVHSLRGCRFCMLSGTYHRRKQEFQFPLVSTIEPMTEPMVLRTHTQTLEFLRLLDSAESLSEGLRENVVEETGINRRSILFDLKTTSFPTSFPVDTMHLLFDDIAQSTYFQWTSDLSPLATVYNDRVSPTAAFKEVGAAMQACQVKIPTSFGAPPRNILKYGPKYKTEEWMDWVIMYSLVFLNDKIPTRVVKGWVKFVSAVKLCLSRTLTNEEINKIHDTLNDFYMHYIEEYADAITDIIPEHRVAFHTILHIAESIREFGPPWVFWQFPMERYCRMLKAHVRSRSNPYNSLITQINLLEKLNHIPFIPSVSAFQLGPGVEEQMLRLDRYQEQLYWPRKSISLGDLELRRLKEYYMTVYECNFSSLEDVPRTGHRYVQLRTKDGRRISSKRFCNLSDEYWENNYTVAAIVRVSRNASVRSRPSDMVEKERYAQVKFYFHHKYRGEDRMLALVRWAVRCRKDEYDLRSFEKFGPWVFIGVEALNRCIGLIKIGQRTYVVDKEYFNALPMTERTD